uniref:Uncharacterized protein n=1 Tax=Myotis myotis TaxID=51298 RepID=A0A7J7XHH4_MYOMY|nr:hypothetical protein mMyoMyo1_011701 [Myotis myotis]
MWTFGTISAWGQISCCRSLQKNWMKEKKSRNQTKRIGMMKAPWAEPGKFMVGKSKIPEVRGRGKGVMKGIKSSYFGKKRLQVEGAPMERGGFLKKEEEMKKEKEALWDEGKKTESTVSWQLRKK